MHTHIQQHLYAHMDACTHLYTKCTHRVFFKNEVKEAGFAWAESVKEIGNIWRTAVNKTARACEFTVTQKILTL